ncbi:NACHT domain-containing protein [Actinoplanes sp. NPDC051475]|uniref:NACHT domain-containing protein n=1 Tax=Actinoplanes sp. NPDC051475 TaxID=3157225 RepID=UPI00344F7720
MPKRRLVALAAAMALVLAGAAFLMGRLGLERADQLSSVLALFVGVFALIAALIAMLPPRLRVRTSRRHRTAWGRRALRDDLRRLLEATRSAADRSPNTLLGARRTAVSTVYVQQRVEQPRATVARPDGRRRRPSRLSDERLFLPFDQQPHVIPVRRPFERVFDEHRHLLIEGGPGTGKSTTAGQVCRQLAASWLTGQECTLSATPLLPLLVTARALAAHVTSTWQEALAAAAFGGLGMSSGEHIEPELLADAVNGVPWLIVVDGLDEVPADERETFLQRLSRWTSSTTGPYRLLITTRPLAGHATSMLGAGSIGHYTLLPFDRRSLGEFAHRWFEADEDGPDQAAGFLAQVTAAGLHDVASVPLMATIAITVYEDNPGTGLPRNRHDLYERYLHWLRQQNADRQDAARRQLVAALRDEGTSDSVVDALFQRTDELLEELAVVRVESRRSLVLTAIEWLRREAGPVTGRPPEDWGRLVAEALVSTGLLSRRDAGPDFIHLTFAEHFAARRHAAELSASFDPDDNKWRWWLHHAIHKDPVAVAVLTRWTREHPAGDLLAWLLDGVSTYHQVAVRLVAEGATATDEQLAICLETVDRELRTTLGPYPDRTLAPLRRFPPSPVLTRWLEAQLERVAAGSPTWSAVAAILGDRDRRRLPELTEKLLRTVENKRSNGGRLAAAKALADIAPEMTARTVETLRKALDTPADATVDRMTLAAYLAEFDGAPRRAAVRTMREVLRDVTSRPEHLRTAAEALAEWDGDSRQEIAEGLLAFLRSGRVPHYHQHEIAKAIIAITPEHQEEIVRWAVTHIDRPASQPYSRLEVAEFIAGLGPGQRHLAAEKLREIATDITTDAQERLAAAGQLAGLGEEWWPDAMETVCGAVRETSLRRATVSLDPLRGADRDLRDQVVQAIVSMADDEIDPRAQDYIRAAAADLDPRYQKHVDAVALAKINPVMSLDELADVLDISSDTTPACSVQLAHIAKRHLTDASSDLPAEVVFGLARGLLDYGRKHALAAVAALRRAAADELTPDRFRFQAALALVQRSDDARTAQDVVLKILASTSPTNAHLNPGQVMQLQRMPSYRRAVRAALCAGLRNPHHGVWLRVSMASQLAMRFPRAVDGVRGELRRLLDERTNRPWERLRIASALVDLSPDPRAADVFRSVSLDPHAPVDIRATAALRPAIAEQDQPNVETLTALAADRHAGLSSRASLLDDLLQVDTAWRTAARELLDDASEAPVDLLATVYLPTAGRLLMGIFARIGTPADLATVGDLFLRSLASDDLDRYDWEQIGGLLARLDGCPAALRSALTADVPSIATLEAAVEVLPEDSALSAGVRRLLDDSSSPARVRIRALEVQLRLSPADRSRAVATLAATMASEADPRRLPAIDRVTTARMLYAIVAHRPAAGAMLTTIVADETEPLICRRSAYDVLDDGGPRARRAAADAGLAELHDECLSMTARCSAAVRHARSAPGSTVEMVAALRRLLVGPLNDEERAEILLTVLAIDPRCQDELDALLVLMRDHTTTPRMLVAVASRLSSGTPVHRLAAGEALEQLLGAPGLPAGRRVALLGPLAHMLPDTLPAAVEELTAVATDPALPPATQAKAAIALDGFASSPAARAAQTALLAILDHPLMAAHHRVLAGRLLLQSFGPHLRAVRQRLLDLDTEPADRLAAAVVVLRAYGPEPAVRLGSPRPAAEEVVRRLLQSPGLPPHAALDAAVALGDAEALRRLAGDETVHRYLRVRALREIAEVSGGEEHARRLWAIVDDPGERLDHRRWAAEALADMSPDLRRPARDGLRALDGVHLDPRARRRLRRSITFIDNGERWIGR